jgi:FKBP-type peptidyl-prolyl cis-trans isomerase 2
MKEVKKDDTVTIHFNCKTDEGQIFSSLKDNKPLTFKVGEGKLLKDIESGVIGMKIKDKRKINVKHQDAYGEVDEDLIQEVNKKKLPSNIEPKPGMSLYAKGPDGKEMRVRIVEVKEDSIIIDANHPLAGKDIEFEIEVVDIVKN